MRDALNLPPVEALARVIFEFAHVRPDAFVVQIGAHDASQLDPLRRYITTKGWRGILVEPVPEVFERLVRNYEGVDGLVFENVAVGPTDGERELYYLPQTTDRGLPRWYDALASFDRDVLLSHRSFIPDIEDRIRSRVVPTLTFESLLARHDISTVDFVQVDTEGFDFEIVNLIDLDRYKPVLLQIEELHLDDDTRRACAAILAGHGYQAIGNGMDLLALRPDLLGVADGRLLRAWDMVHVEDDPRFRV